MDSDDSDSLGQGFVQADPSRGLLLNGKPYKFAGANCHYLMTKASAKCDQSRPFEVLDCLADMGIRCIRTWAFADGDYPHALQPYPKYFDENVFTSLDQVIHYCREKDMRILLELTNFWEDYGGMAQYVKWSIAKKKNSNKRKAASRSLTATRRLPLRFTRTRVVYRDDPTILGFGLANEPRCYADPGCSKHVVAKWAHQHRVIKNLDKNHLVFMDCEGFFGPSTKGLMKKSNPFDTSEYGTDFAQDCSSPYIDVCCIHLYPEKWLPRKTASEHVAFMSQYIQNHIDICQKLDKPLIISEFGFLDAGKNTREDFYVDLYAILLHYLKKQRGACLSGCMFWHAASKHYPHHDGYTVHVDVGQDSKGYIREIIEEFASSYHSGGLRLNSFASSRFSPDAPAAAVPEKVNDPLIDKERFGSCTCM
eukprot:jgi/Picre1/28671/NNA_004071.t1